MMKTTKALSDSIVGREQEMQALRTAIQKRESKLIWGRSDAGKTYLIQQVVAELSQADRRKCIYCAGAPSGRQLVAHFLRGLYLLGDPLVCRKVHADRADEITLDRWINNQSLLRLRGILFSASEQGEYRFFVDHLPVPTHKMAHLMKEIMNRCRTPIYFTGHGYSQREIGYAWSLYWTDEYRIRLDPLKDVYARELLEICIRKFGLSSLDLEGFREDILNFSGRLPGSIVKMCLLASNPHYHYGAQVKVKLVHVDYLLQGNRFLSSIAPSYTT